MAKSNKATTKKLEKFGKDTIEGTAIRTIKGRQKKIATAGNTLAGLWYEQGKELRELQLILDCSERKLEQHTGLKRSAINAYIKIAEDPRIGEPEVVKQLGNFSQKELMKLGTLDEEDFNTAVEVGHLPKPPVVEVVEPDGEDAPAKAEKTPAWKTEMIKIVTEGLSAEAVMAHLTEEFGFTEAEVEDADTIDEVDPTRALLIDALAKTGESSPKSQAVELGITVKQLEKALSGVISTKVIDKCNAYLAE